MTFRVYAAFAAALVLCACGGSEPAPVAEAPAPPAADTAANAVPPAVDGWREYPLPDHVVSIRPGKWRTDVIDVPVPAGKGLEYKLTMKNGDGLVYTVTYGELEHAGLMVVEFHGHTEQVDGVGDLMYYSKGGGSEQSGVFTAPWDGIHGWYLKNDGDKDVVVRLELAGFYEPQAK
jgi:hypothetical protein